MRISTIVARLEAIKKSRGDIEVMVQGKEGGVGNLYMSSIKVKYVIKNKNKETISHEKLYGPHEVSNIRGGDSPAVIFQRT